MKNATTWPLAWPQSIRRTKNPGKSTFKNCTISKSMSSLHSELQRFGKDAGTPVRNILVSSNYSLTEQRPKDAGVAVYFLWGEDNVCISVDRYTTVEENIHAISKVLEAKRAIGRHGGFNLVQAAFRGYAALPPPSNLNRDWREILGDQSTVQGAKNKRNQLLKDWGHGTAGANNTKCAEVIAAFEDAERYFSRT